LFGEARAWTDRQIAGHAFALITGREPTGYPICDGLRLFLATPGPIVSRLRIERYIASLLSHGQPSPVKTPTGIAAALTGGRS
jgi:hypothetical protein